MPDHSVVCPHLIHIGFPKCASTYLQAWFAAHPQIAYRPGGLAGMYTIYDVIAEMLENPNNIRCAVTSAEQITAPIDPADYGRVKVDGATHLRDSIEQLCVKLASMFPDARILMITRNHADVLKSGYSQMVRHGRLELGREIQSLNSQALAAAAPYDYDHVREVYSENFGGRILALPYELLVDNETEFLRQIAVFIGVDAFQPAIGKVNEGLSDDELYYYPVIGSALRRFALTGWLYRRLSWLHRFMILKGGWKPLFPIIARFKSRAHVELTITSDVLDTMSDSCQMLIQSEIYAPYRGVYHRTK